MVNAIVIWGTLTAALVSIGLSLDLILGYMLSHVDLLLGMGMGMTTGPLMMTLVKRWRTKRKVDKLLNEIIQMRKEQEAIQEKQKSIVTTENFA